MKLIILWSNVVFRGGHGSGLGLIFYPTRQSGVCKSSTRWPSVKVVGSGGLVDRFWRAGTVGFIGFTRQQNYIKQTQSQTQTKLSKIWYQNSNYKHSKPKHKHKPIFFLDLTRSHQIRWDLTRSSNHSTRNHQIWQPQYKESRKQVDWVGYACLKPWRCLSSAMASLRLRPVRLSTQATSSA